MKKCKLLTIVLFTFYLFSVPFVNAQTDKGKKITIEFKNENLTHVLKRLEKVSGYKIIFAYPDVNRFTVSGKVENANITEALKVIIADKPLEFDIDGIFINITLKNDKDATRKSKSKISGTIIYEDDNTPVISASVKVKGTNMGVKTDNNGHFELADITEGTLLEISYIGLKTVFVHAKPNMNIKMRSDVQNLKEVVVTGIFDKKKSSYTGAVRVITDKDLELFQGRNIFTTLKNIDPSFNIVDNNSWGADPNRLPDVQIRGAGNLPSLDQLQDQTTTALNTPLIILNGFETTLQRMMDLNEQEIQSISILKDGAATSLYGSRGANGIIVITTKDPQAGKLRLSLRSEFNFNIPDLNSYHLLNSRDKLELERLSGYYESATKTAAQNIELQQYYNEILAKVAQGVNTDWLAKPLHLGFEQNYNLKLEGGDSAFQYDISLQYKNQPGVMKGSERNTLNGGIDLSYRSKNLIFRDYLSIGYIKSNESPYGSFSKYAELNPYWEPYDKDGNILRYFTPYSSTYWLQTGDVRFGSAYPNPMYDATLNTYDKTETTSIINNFSIEWRPIQELTFRSSIAITKNNGDRDAFKPANHSDFVNYTGSDIFRKGSYTYVNSKGFNYALNFTANYSKTFAEKHTIFAGINGDLTQNKSRNYNFVAEGFPDESIDFLGMALQYQKDGSPSGSESTIRRIGLVTNVNYSYKNRYLLDLSYRVDGASLYGKNSRYAGFWSSGVGWNIYEEDFVKEKLKFIDRLRLRFSYGTTGSQNFSAYQAQATYRYYTSDRYNTWMGAYQIDLGNNNLKWQKRNKYNLGLDLAIFRNRFVLEANIYKENTSNLLSSLELPYSNGFTNYVENVGKLMNKGFELSATAYIIRDTKHQISWSITGNIAHDKDKIVHLSEAMKAASEKLALVYTGSTPNQILREGDSQYTIYVVPSLGIDPSTGKELFRTKDGEVTYTWSPKDRVAAGNSMPKYRGNFSTMLRYKEFTFNASFGYRFGGQLYNSTLRDKVEVNNKMLNVDQRVFSDRWKQPGDKARFRGINDFSVMYPTSRFLEDENTFTCQNISLRYETRNKAWLKSFGAEYLSLTASTGELFYISTVKRERGTSYPFTRQFLLSASLMF